MALGYTYCIKRDYIEITLTKVLNFLKKGIKESIKKILVHLLLKYAYENIKLYQ